MKNVYKLDDYRKPERRMKLKFWYAVIIITVVILGWIVYR